MHSIVLFVSLMAFYVVLSGQVTNGFLMGAGAVCCAGIVALCRRMGIVDDEGIPHRYWLRTALYSPWLLWQIVLSNIAVLKIVWRPGPMRDTSLYARWPHSLKTSYGLVSYCNSITLTPGTLTCEVGEHELLIHCLDPQFAGTIEKQPDGTFVRTDADEMHSRCKHIEGSH